MPISQGSHVTQLTAALVFLILMGIFRLIFVRRAQDPFGVFLLCFGVFYGFRAVLIASGLDTPLPSYLFATSDMDVVYTRTVLGLCLFLVAFMGAAYLVTRHPARSPGLLFSPHPTNVKRLVIVGFALTGVALVTQSYLLARFGSFANVIHASKVDKALAGEHYLMLPGELAALCCTAAYLELRHRLGPKTSLRFVMLGCAVLNSVLVFAWGARSFLVIIVAMLILVSGPIREPRQQRRQGIAGVVRVVLAAVLVLSMAVFLRTTRDSLVRPGGTDSFAQQGTFRQASQAVNGNYFDASMLAFRDWPANHQFRNGKDFVNGFLDVVPKKVWPGKPSPFAPQFRQYYEPHTVNGWPVGAPTTWYLDFGWFGLLIGGLISGAVIGEVARRYAAAPWSGVNTALTFTLGAFVLQTGWGGQTPQNIVAVFLPVAIMLRIFVTRTTTRKRHGETRMAPRRSPVDAAVGGGHFEPGVSTRTPPSWDLDVGSGLSGSSPRGEGDT
jgi:hypothetical protein